MKFGKLENLINKSDFIFLKFFSLLFFMCFCWMDVEKKVKILIVQTTKTILKAENISLNLGGNQILQDINIEIKDADISIQTSRSPAKIGM